MVGFLFPEMLVHNWGCYRASKVCHQPECSKTLAYNTVSRLSPPSHVYPELLISTASFNHLLATKILCSIQRCNLRWDLNPCTRKSHEWQQQIPPIWDCMRLPVSRCASENAFVDRGTHYIVDNVGNRWSRLIYPFINSVHSPFHTWNTRNPTQLWLPSAQSDSDSSFPWSTRLY